ncbi:hypothetical protein ACTXT7_004514 [Hymenolepis weldensis]
MGKETVEKILESMSFRYQTTPHVGAQIWVCYRKYLPIRCVTVSFEPKTDPTEIYLDSYYLSRRGISKPRRLYAIISLIVILDT